MRSSMVLSKSGKPRRTLAASCLASSTRSGAKSSAAASRLPVWFQSSACSRRTRALFSSTDMLLLFVSAFRTLAGQTLPTVEYDASYRSAAHALSTGELRRIYLPRTWVKNPYGRSAPKIHRRFIGYCYVETGLRLEGGLCID